MSLYDNLVVTKASKLIDLNLLKKYRSLY